MLCLSSMYTCDLTFLFRINRFPFFRIFSRKGIIIFKTPSPQLEPKERRKCEADLRAATKGASTGFLEVLASVQHFFSEEGQGQLDDEISAQICGVFEGFLRCQSNYEKLVWFTHDVRKTTYLISDFSVTT